MWKIRIPFLLLSILLILFFWKNTILNISDHLYDWNDSLYFIWVIQNHINNFSNFDFSRLFGATAMYPFKFVLSFGEQFFFPSILMFLVSRFNQNPIFQLNLLFIANHVLIFASFFLLISLFVRNFWAKIISSFYISFSPYIFTQLGHLQMIFLWPLFISLFFLFRDKDSKNIKTGNLVTAGLFLGIQFMSSIYLGAMGAFVIFLYFSTRLFLEGRLRFFSKQLLILLGVFVITAGISIYGYMLAQITYGGKRDMREFIIYSAHLTDYIFPLRGQTSLLYQSSAVERWKNFDRHYIGEKAGFIGALPLIIIIFYLLKYKKDKNGLSLFLNLNRFTLFFLILALVGFVFSLGPRLNVNGTYLHLPLPYYLVLKVIPLIEFLRGLARWFSIVTLAAAFLLAMGLDRFLEDLRKKISERNVSFIGIFIFILFIIEFYPKPLEVSRKEWWSRAYSYMTGDLCVKNNPAVLEYPFIYRNTDANLIRDLQYKMVILLASTRHTCRILSGFSGYEPPGYIDIKEQLDSNGIDENDLMLLKKLGFSYIKLNKFAISGEEQISLPEKLKDFGLKNVYNDADAEIYEL